MSATMFDCESNREWTITEVYGPLGELEKRMFLMELKRIKGCLAKSPATRSCWWRRVTLLAVSYLFFPSWACRVSAFVFLVCNLLSS
jgi:hypothetical protein